jgi:hypothetical protein
LNESQRREVVRIETKQRQSVLHVAPTNQGIELRIGEEADARARMAALSLPQARMLLHALGLAVAQVEERQRLEAEERANLAERILDQEFRRDASPRPASVSGGEWKPVVLGPRAHPSVVRPLTDERLRGQPYDYGIALREEQGPSLDEGAGNSSS